MTFLYKANKGYRDLGGHDAEFLGLQSIPLSSLNPSADTTRLIGKPAPKKKIHFTDLLAATICVICLVLAIASVASEDLSWQLGRGTYQLIVLGFLLSVMQLCLASVATTLFLLIEARFGSSTLQNYEGILRNEFMASKLSLYWRVLLGLMIALPITLSVAYKSFVGGESSKRVKGSDYELGNLTFGQFGPPGLQSIGDGKGSLLFFNITLPFTIATSWSSLELEQPLPSKPQAYGFNTLFLNNESTAILDTPHPDSVTIAQSMLANGESWNVTAHVTGTVATLNRTKETNYKAWSRTFIDYCDAAQLSSGAFTHQSLMNDWAINLVDHASPGNQSRQYICLAPDPGINIDPTCDDIVDYCRQFDVVRKSCWGTWTITRGGIELLDGECTGEILPPENQLIITDNSLFLGVWYMSSLRALLAPFSAARNNSVWTTTSFATAAAAMLWSSITDENGPANTEDKGFLRSWKDDNDKSRLISFEQAGLMYSVDETIIYTRPTLRKSPGLYAVLAAQPLLTLLVLAARWRLYSTPLGKGFGLVSILSGINRDSLDALHGAGLSGELSNKIKINIQTAWEGDKPVIRYSIAPTSSIEQQGKVLAKRVYY